MSTRLSEWLASNDGLGLEEYSDGEQALDVHVASEPSVDHDVNEMAEAEIEQDEIGKDLEELAESETALEDYCTLLEVGIENGGISAQSAAFMRVGLEHIERRLSLDTELTPGIEAFGGSASQMRSTTVSVEAIKDVLERTWEATKRALEALVRAIRDFLAKATKGAGRLHKRAVDLRKKGRDLKGAPNKSTVTLKSTNKVFANGDYHGNDTGPVMMLAEYGMRTYLERVRKYASDVASTLSSMDPANIKEGYTKLTKLDGVFDRFIGNTNVSPSSDKRFSDTAVVKRTDVLPGNVALYISHPDKSKGGDPQTELRRMLKDLRVEVLSVPDAKDAPKEYEVKVEGVNKINQRLDEISKAAKVVKDGEKDAAKAAAAIDELVKAGDAFKEKAKKAELDDESQRLVSAALRGVKAVQSLLGQSVNGMISYSIKTLNAQLKVAEMEMAAYGGNPNALPDGDKDE